MRKWSLPQPSDSSSALSVLLVAVVPSPPNPLLSHRLGVSVLPWQAQSTNPTTDRRGLPSARCSYGSRKEFGHGEQCIQLPPKQARGAPGGVQGYGASSSWGGWSRDGSGDSSPNNKKGAAHEFWRVQYCGLARFTCCWAGQRRPRPLRKASPMTSPCQMTRRRLE
jgi:hypothetical protein